MLIGFFTNVVIQIKPNFKKNDKSVNQVYSEQSNSQMTPLAPRDGSRERDWKKKKNNNT